MIVNFYGSQPVHFWLFGAGSLHLHWKKGETEGNGGVPFFFYNQLHERERTNGNNTKAH